MPQANDDSNLMLRVQQRDRAALDQLFDKYNTLVTGIGLRILRNRADAEELLVDVFFEIWDRADRFDVSRGSFTTYLTTLTRSRAIDKLRSRGTATRELDSIPEVVSDGPASPVGDAVLSEQRERIAQVLDKLDPDQRSAIECAYFSGLSHSEIAAALKRPLGTIKTQIRQGLIRLKELLRTE